MAKTTQVLTSGHISFCGQPQSCMPKQMALFAYAGYAIAKGHITRALTRWLVIEQQFSEPFC